MTIFERVAARANRGGLPISVEAVIEIARLLREERRAAVLMPSRIYSSSERHDFLEPR